MDKPKLDTQTVHAALSKTIYETYFYNRFHLNVPYDETSMGNLHAEAARDIATDIMQTMKILKKEWQEKDTRIIHAVLVHHEK